MEVNRSRLKNTLWLCLIVGLGIAAPGAAMSAEPRALTWQQLAPDADDIENPFLELSVEQTWTFRSYLQQLQVPELEHTVEQQETLRALRADLEADGLQPDEMVQTYETLVAQYQRAATATRPELLGEQVKLAGYLLPLRVQDGEVTEFLLVPTVGACIHEPQPPPNQMVHVRFEKGFKDAGLFDPVWIRGELRADARTEELFLFDGASDVNVSYAMDADDVWLF